MGSERLDDVTAAILHADRFDYVGWKDLVRPLVMQCDREGVKILQVKEKFGKLRFYVLGGSEQLHAMIERAELRSGECCQECGTATLTYSHNGWLRTKCPSCRTTPV